MASAVWLITCSARCESQARLTARCHKQEQTQSLVIQLLPSKSARSGNATEGEPLNPPRICPPKQLPLYCLRFFTTRLIHLPASVTVSLKTVFQMVRERLARNQLVLTRGSCFLRKRRCFRRCSENHLVSPVNIARIRSDYEVVPSRVQRFNTIRARIPVSN